MEQQADASLETIQWLTPPRSSSGSFVAQGGNSTPIEPPRLHTMWYALHRAIRGRLRLIAQLVRISPLSYILTLVDMLRTWWYLGGELRRVRQLFDELQPVALLLASDRHREVEPVFIRVARERMCLTFIVPALNPTSDPLVDLRKDKSLHQVDSAPQKMLKQWLCTQYPGHVHQSQYGRLLYYTPGITLALDWRGMLPPQPWHMGGGLADLLAVFSEHMRRQYLQAGIPASKMVLTGQPSLDSLYQATCQRQQIIDQVCITYGLNPSNKRIICALPQLAEHHFVSWERHWEEIEFLVATIAQTKTDVLLSLHPKSNSNHYQFLVEKYGVHLLQEPLNTVLPVADVFVASFSGTIHWAVLLEIPTVLVDFYNFGYDMYNHLEGVVKITDKPLLQRVLSVMLENGVYYTYLQQQQQKAAISISRLDGQSCQRVLDVVEMHVKRCPAIY
jgi:hypothetical protein